MGGNAIYLGDLYTKDQLVKMYADLLYKIKVIELYLDYYFDDCKCLVCNEDYNQCRCYYDVSEAYLEKIKDILEGKKDGDHL